MAKLQLKPEQVVSKKDYLYWIIDIEENNLPSDPQSIKDLLLNRHLDYLGLDFLIESIEFFKFIQTKVILLCKEL